MNALKTSLVLLTLGMSQIALADTGTPDPSMQIPSFPGQYGDARTADPVLLIRDFLPWGGDIVPFFTSNGCVVTVINSADIGTVNLTDYCLIAVTAGTTGYYDTIYQDNVNAYVTNGAFGAYVTGGGVMLYQTGTWGGSILLPGGGYTYLSYDPDNWFTGPHCTAWQMPYPQFNGNYASHDILVGVPGTFIVGTNGDPVAAQYTMGAGHVLVLTQPVECYIPGGYCYGQAPHFNQFENNAINCARALGNCGDPYVDANDSPVAFELKGNHPNPFNPVTTISFSLPETADANLSVFSLTGERVATLVNGMTERGEHQVSFNAEALSSGLYIYRLEALGQVQSGRMLLVK